jgi:HEAT repeat protein
MPIAVLPRITAFVFIASYLLLSHQESTNPPGAQQTNTPAQQQPANSSPTPPESQKPEQQPTTAEQGSEPAQKPAPKPLRTAKAQAWQILHTACSADKAIARAIAVGVLGLLPGNPRARKMAEKALTDEKSEVRSSAAVALGAMQSKASIAKLREAADDQDPSVALAAAHSLIQLNDDSGYEVYYEVLTGKRKGKKGLIASETAVLKDPKKMAELGIQEGIGFIPFAGMGWQAFKVIHKGDSSPVRAAAAKVLTKDPDPDTTKALADAVGDKNWVVRAAALEALAGRGDPSVLDTVELYMSDDKDAVKYTAAAAVVRLSAIKESGTPVKQKGRKRRRDLRRQKSDG